ncbi:MAG: type II and III secretion system protein family protein [Bauldia sp.]|uniref:type II and III secretion system protein family protein n=1 Tax=Bauldia sp. TaxID=2575872 RepID=UPI001D315E27|nr:type II and III secretion system protein family protein [Bauldia sp.]MCB1495532.1 type II and III secretion system protein family protein [Bauldia sp.]
MVVSVQRGLLAAMSVCVGLAAFAAAIPARADSVEPVPASAAISKSLKLGLNKALVVDLPRDARDVLISNPEIADAVMRTPRRMYLTGVAVGQASIIVFDRAGQQIVTLDLQVERDNATLERMLHRLIPGSDIATEIVSDNIIMSGTVRTAADARKAQDIANIFANGGANAQPGNGGAGSGGAADSGGVTIALGGSGEVPTSNVVNLLTIEGEDQVHLKVTVAEVQRNILKQLGIDINGAISIGSFKGLISSALPFGATNTSPNSVGVAGSGSPSAGCGALGNSSCTFNNGIMGAVRALDQTGMIKTLAEPTLTAISGESASFLAGGEFPVPTSQDQDGNVIVEYKPFGVALSFTPVVLSEGRISLRVKTEVSDLNTEDQIVLNNITLPSITVRRSETTLELPSGGSMIMAGMLRDNIRQAVSGLPALGKLPILGTLFRSREFKRSETELVIIVTPYLVSPVSRTQLAKPDDGFAPAGDGAATFLGRLNRVYGVEGKPAPAGSYRGTYGFIFE